nr:sigma-70 family RNA polymerase sigma factor [Aridibaculum aurantiacum]
MLDKFYHDGNNQWLGILLQRYTLLLLGLCMKYLKNEEEAKDCVQQIFLKAITELQKYKVDYFKSWLYMVAKNHCLMKLRESHGKYAVEVTENIARQDDETDLKLQLHEKDRTLNTLHDSLHELNEEQKQCVTLFYLQKKSYQEIADTTGYTLLQVKSYIQNGKRNLKLIIQKKLKQN